MNKIKVYLADDNLVARQMLNNMISSSGDMEVVGESGTGQGCIIMLEETRPDVVLLKDGISGGMSSSDIIKEIRGINASIKTILCVDAREAEADHILAATDLGVITFFSKPYKKIHLLRVIRERVTRV